jgi:hypothetical protein
VARIIDLMRQRSDTERKGMFPSLHGEGAYKIETGMIGKLLGGAKLVDFGNDIDEGYTYRRTIRVPNYLTRQQVKRLLIDTFTRQSGCGHSYDCCGCSSYSVSNVQRIRRGQFSFHLRKNYNY